MKEFFGGAYELTNGLAKSYYNFAGQTIMKDSNGDLTYFLTDHLGSVVAITDDQGNLISQQRYLPFGGVRLIPNSQSLITDFGYTGQRNLDDDIGLMDYKARFYSPVLNRFIQPDSIVPGMFNPQNLNRFSYVRNNPIRFNDPTGHVACQGANWDDGPQCFGRTREERLKKLGITIDEDMPEDYVGSIIAAAIDVGGAFAKKNGGSAESAFKNVYGAVYFEYGCGDPCRKKDKNGKAYGDPGGAFAAGWQSNKGYFQINIATMSGGGGILGTRHMVHELGHIHNYVIELNTDTARIDTIPSDVFTRNSLRPNGYTYNGVFTEQDDVLLWQFHPLSYGNGASPSETYADMFVAWTYNAWNTSTDQEIINAVSAAQGWMP